MHMGTTLRPEPIRRYADGSPPCTWGQRTCGPPGTGCVPVHPHAHGDNGRIFGAGHQVDRFTPMHMGTTQIATTGNNLRTVHPHAHGDNSTSVVGVEACVGSPPCTWGQPQRIRAQYYYRRFTPMHMGTTAAFAASFAAWPVHPHAHGDNTSGILPAMRTIGSPPCTWGQRGDDSAYLRRPRFTPMHMGTTEQRSCEACRTAVHPHAHGDNNHLAAVLSLQVGSPPCTWGQPPPVAGLAAGGAVHPHAHGDNDRVSARGRTLPVHPHAHGDNERLSEAAGGRRFTPMHMGTTMARSKARAAAAGSPPCTWGQLANCRHGGQGKRFTPMHMGTTSHKALDGGQLARFTPMHMGTTCCWPCRVSWGPGSPPCTWGQRPPRTRPASGRPVHPHAHGDNTRDDLGELGEQGSPPCTWGQRSCFSPGLSGGTVHPHAHGDNASIRTRQNSAAGSPPCTWGQREAVRSAAGGRRFTPMHMGTTRRPRRCSSPSPVHPHAHGDNDILPAWLPPQRRFTPMHMGTTPQVLVCPADSAVHPHAHGDNHLHDGRVGLCFAVHPHAHGDN